MSCGDAGGPCFTVSIPAIAPLLEHILGVEWGIECPDLEFLGSSIF